MKHDVDMQLLHNTEDAKKFKNDWKGAYMYCIYHMWVNVSAHMKVCVRAHTHTLARSHTHTTHTQTDKHTLSHAHIRTHTHSHMLQQGRT
jgi:hypothetical protein